MLEIRDLKVSLGDFRLEIPQFSIPEGIIQIILGPTGAGKTLFLEVLLGLIRPQEGRIFFRGQDLTKVPPEKRGLGYVPQDLALFPHLTVEENIFFGTKKKEAWLSSLIKFLGLKGLLHRPVTKLSGGEKQRVALARALAPGYKVLLLDEPLSALHETLRQELWFVLRELRDKLGLTVILVTHDLREAFFLGERVALLFEGRIIENQTAEDLYFRPRTLKAARFLGIRNLYPGEIISHKPSQVKVPVLEKVFSLESLPENASRQGFLGIRAEEVIVVRPGYVRSRQENLFTVEVEKIFFKGAFYLVRARRGGAQVEIELPFYAFRKLKPCPRDQIQVIFPQESLFWLEESE